MRTNASILMASLALLGLVGCSVDEAPSLVLSSFHGLNAGEDACVHTDQPISSRLFDLQVAHELGQGYMVYVRLENGLVSNEDLERGQLDTHRIEVTRLRVSYGGEDWETLPEPVRVPVAGVLIEPGGEYFTPVGVIPAAVVDELVGQAPEGAKPARLEVRVTAEGRTLDGSEVVSNPLSLAVEACEGCLGASCHAIGGVLVPLCQGAFAQSDGAQCMLPEELPDDGATD